MKGLLAVLQAVMFGWLVALVRLLRAICARLRRLLRESAESERERKAAKSRCVPIQDPAFVRPDPLIYSQTWLAAHGLNCSWQNPDFRIVRNGATVESHQLQPATDYEVVVRVWNGSLDGPAVAMPVRLSYLSFGIGTVAHPIDSVEVDVGVKGGAGCPAFATIPWRTPASAGHYCLLAQLDPVDDAEYGNNLGQHNTDVVQAHSPATFAFALRNPDERRERAYRFSVDTYAMPRPPPCLERPGAFREDPDALHRGDHPLPTGWTVQLAPPNPVLAPGAEISITATVTPPSDFSGSQVVNVHAYYSEFHADHLAGGVTVRVTA